MSKTETPLVIEERIDAFAGASIQRLRRARRMNQRTLGEACGVSFQQIQKMESGRNRVGAGRLFIIANLFGVPVAEFFPKE